MGEGKVKFLHQNLLLPFGGNIKEILRTREVDKVLMDLQISSWQSLMIVIERLQLFCQILNLLVKVIYSMYSVYKLSTSQIIGLKPYEDG